MSINRIQKLLFSEYCDFEEMVLIESPFAQISRDGRGIRQVYLGLTPTKLVLATDFIPPVENCNIHFLPGIDPDIETFELIAIYPVECVNLSIYSKQKKQAIKAHFCNNKVLFFELGGFEHREMFWNLWRERIKFLSPHEDENDNSSKSQTSVAPSSSSTSTIYLVDRKKVLESNGSIQLWCKFDTNNNDYTDGQLKWTNRYLYIGSNYEESYDRYSPKMKKPTLGEFVKHPKLTRNKTTPPNSEMTNDSSTTIFNSFRSNIPINRFAVGIQDNCSLTLLMPRNVDKAKRKSDLPSIAEACVKCWEENSSKRSKQCHIRRHAYCPHPFFLHGLGPWSVSPGMRFSIQVKRVVSEVGIRKQPVELRLPISKRQLLATISHDCLRLIDRSGNNGKFPLVLFWTPCYWYRPRTAKHAYDELRRHLSKIKKWRSKRGNMSFFKRNKRCTRGTDTESDKSELISIRKSPKRKETPLMKLKKSLRIDLILTAWDFDSSTLAQQLTMIEVELFARVTTVELAIIVWQQSSKNTPNISAIIAFAHRISCLIVNEILREENVKSRARLLARFVGVAEKCHEVCNFQSSRTVLAGLQNLAVFRLKTTWAYVRKKHVTKYKTFERLCRLYKDVRLPAYQKSCQLAIRRSAWFLPQIADILARLLDRMPKFKNYHEDLCDNARNNQTVFRKPLASSGFKELHHHFKPKNFHQDNKIKCLQETAKFLQFCQSVKITKYSFERNELAREYLLKARYREDKENFFLSLNAELPH